jgi:hypothetical protein
MAATRSPAGASSVRARRAPRKKTAGLAWVPAASLSASSQIPGRSRVRSLAVRLDTPHLATRQNASRTMALLILL